MRILIAGMDGYPGWSLSKHLTRRGHQVAGADALLRRRWVEEMGSHSALPIPSVTERLDTFKAHYGTVSEFTECDLTDYDLVCDLFAHFEPMRWSSLLSAPRHPIP